MACTWPLSSLTRDKRQEPRCRPRAVLLILMMSSYAGPEATKMIITSSGAHMVYGLWPRRTIELIMAACNAAAGPGLSNVEGWAVEHLFMAYE